MAGRRELPGEMEISPPTNSFLLYLGANQENIGILQGLYEEVLKERSSREEADATTLLIARASEIQIETFGQPIPFRRYRQWLLPRLFKPQSEDGDGRLAIGEKETRRLSHGGKQRRVIWEADAEGFYRDYQKVVGQLEEAMNEPWIEVEKNFDEYMVEDPQRIFDFSTFLTDSSFQTDRDSVEGFITYMGHRDAIHKGGLTEWLRELWLEKALEGVYSDQTLVPFLEKHMANGSERAELLRLMIKLTDGDVQSLARQFSQLQPDEWPKHFRSLYEKEVAATIMHPIANIKRVLQEYRERHFKRYPVEIAQEEERISRKRRRLDVLVVILDEDKAPVSPEEEQPAKIALLKKRGTRRGRSLTGDINLLPENRLERYLEKVAGRLSRDRALFRDIKKCLETLAANPFGHGTKQLKDFVVKIGGKDFPMYRYEPQNRGDDFEVPLLTRDLRISYVVLNVDGQKVVAIDRIESHEEFDKLSMS